MLINFLPGSTQHFNKNNLHASTAPDYSAGLKESPDRGFAMFLVNFSI